MPKVWKLHECANEYRSLLPGDLSFFNGKFRCKSLMDDWDLPLLSNTTQCNTSWPKAVLQRLLDRPFIYGTAHFRARLEEPARLNLMREIEEWEATQ